MGGMPVIGVTPLVDRERESYWMLPGYFEGVSEAGGVPVMLPLTDDAASLARALGACDGLLVAGGQDLAPSLYGLSAADGAGLVGETCLARDAMEAALLPMALAADVPVLGVCRGLQAMNALLGGTLWADIPKQLPSGVEHHGGKPYDRPDHEVDVLPATPLAEVVGAGRLPVNSYHHQGIRRLAEGLSPMARADDGLVEAVWRPGSRFVWGVQWHPEFARATDAPSRAIFSAFVSAAADFALARGRD